MSDRLPDNLETLYSAFSKEAIEGLFSGDVYELDGVEFVCKYAPGSTPDRFHIVKPLPFVEYFVEFSRAFEAKRIFELGIAEGGSTALLALVTSPEKLVAVDLEPQRLAALDEFVDRRGLSDRVKLHYSVDQSDKEHLRRIVSEEFAGERLHLVLDDASHQLAPTRASFEALFPYLAPGGVFTIEDWNADIRFRDAVVEGLRNPTTPQQVDAANNMRAALAAKRSADETAPHASMSQLAIELLLACAAANDVVVEVTMNEYWIIVRRGPAAVDPASFRLADLYGDYFGYLRRGQ